MASLDYAGISASMLSLATNVLTEWLPGGKFKGKYYECSTIQGGDGYSFKVNLENGLWGEFNGSGHSGKDFIDLYGTIYGLSNHDSALKLNDLYLNGSMAVTPMKSSVVIAKIPPEGNVPYFFSYGKKADRTWCYRNAQGVPMSYIARFDKPDGKDILPYTWNGKEWVNKAHPAPRPLYGLELLQNNPQSPVLLVEGEKAADAARELLGAIYCVMTWSGGANAVEKADFGPLFGRKVLLWPDADDAGKTAMARISEKLLKACPEVKILDPYADPDPKKDGWDAADAWASNWKQSDVVFWAKQRVRTVEIPSPEVEVLKKLVKNQVTQVEDVTDQAETPTALKIKWFETGISQTEKGVPIYNEENILRIFENDPSFKDFIWYDEFHKKQFTNWSYQHGLNGTTTEWDEKKDDLLLIKIQRDWGLSKAVKHQVRTACQIYANQRVRNEPKDWLNSLEWDEIPRIDFCFEEAFGAESNEYIRSISKNFFIGMVARIMHPGCQLDTMPVFEGPQGSFKSSALRIIGGKWYASCRSAIGTPNFYSNIQGKWLVEIAEMDSFKKAEISQIKEMLTNTTDRFRRPYSINSEDFPRQCLFGGSTNEQTYLGDMTGARRFWPIATKNINLEWLEMNRSQLFAEAASRYGKFMKWKEEKQIEARSKADEHYNESIILVSPDNYWVTPEEQTRIEQELRRMTDPWEDVIFEYIKDKSFYGVRTHEILKALNFPMEKQGHKEVIRIARILTHLGWSKNQERVGNEIVKIWKPTERT